MTTDLRLRSIRISDATWERWQAMAKDSGMSVTALITKSVDQLAAAQAVVMKLSWELAASKKEEG